MSSEEEYNKQVMHEALNDGCLRSSLTGPYIPPKTIKNPKIICIIPALPSELKIDTIQSILNQTTPVTHTVLLTEKINDNIPFPAKISKVINSFLENIKLEKYDYMLRVDADTILPPNFIEENLKKDYDALGYGYAQIIKVPPFIEVLGGKLNKHHDDGYILVKLRYTNYKASSKDYNVAPILKRNSGFHHGSSWFAAQGELNYMYGADPVSVLFNTVYSFNKYTIFQIYGYFKALVTHKERFDVAAPVIYRHCLKYRHPLRFFRVGIYIKKKIMERQKHESSDPTTNYVKH